MLKLRFIFFYLKKIDNSKEGQKCVLMSIHYNPKSEFTADPTFPSSCFASRFLVHAELCMWVLLLLLFVSVAVSVSVSVSLSLSLPSSSSSPKYEYATELLLSRLNCFLMGLFNYL